MLQATGYPAEIAEVANFWWQRSCGSLWLFWCHKSACGNCFTNTIRKMASVIKKGNRKQPLLLKPLYGI